MLTVQLLRPNGDSFWLEITSAVEFDSSNTLSRIYGTAQDITKYKQTEDALRKSEVKFKTLIHNIPGMVYRGSPDWSSEVIGGSFMLCGYKEDEFNLNKVNWIDLIHPDDKGGVLSCSMEITKEQTDELQEKLTELERMNEVFTGREFRIKELRNRVRELKQDKTKGC